MMSLKKLTTGESDFKRVTNFLIDNFVPEHDMGTLSASNLNLEKAFKWIAWNIKEAAFVIEDEEGEVIGSIGLNKTSPWYSDAEYLTDGWFYVSPKYRKSGIAATLIEAAKKYAKQDDLPLIIGVFSKTDAVAKSNIMNKLGLITVGGMFAAGV